MQNRAFNDFVVMILLVSFPGFILAQSGVKSLDKTFNWEKTNKTETIYINVDEASEKLDIHFEGRIAEGDFQLSAYDPEGNKVAWFSLICSDSDHAHVHVETSGSGSNVTVTSSSSGSSASSNSNSDSDSDAYNTNTATTTATAASGKNKVKTKQKSKQKDGGSSYTVTTTSSNHKGSKGVMKKVVPDPTPGQWKFVMEMEDVSGLMDVQIEQD